MCRGHERVELYLYAPYGPYGLYRASVPVQGCNLPYTLVFKILCRHENSSIIHKDIAYKWKISLIYKIGFRIKMFIFGVDDTI
jgi:hypothetical protein